MLIILVVKIVFMYLYDVMKNASVPVHLWLSVNFVSVFCEVVFTVKMHLNSYRMIRNPKQINGRENFTDIEKKESQGKYTLVLILLLGKINLAMLFESEFVIDSRWMILGRIPEHY